MNMGALLVIFHVISLKVYLYNQKFAFVNDQGYFHLNGVFSCAMAWIFILGSLLQSNIACKNAVIPEILCYLFLQV